MGIRDALVGAHRTPGPIVWACLVLSVSFFVWPARAATYPSPTDEGITEEPGPVSEVKEDESPQTARPEFSPVRVVRPFRPITDPPLIGANEARDALRDAELVLGVAVSGTARAYPINMLTGPQREIINDVLEGTAIAATW